MAIVVSEKYKGVRRDATSAEVIYLVFGTDADAGNVTDEIAFDAVVSSTPSTWDGIPGANVDVRAELVQGTIWEVAALYGESGGESIIFQEATVDYEFSFQASSEKIFQSIQTIGAYAATGPVDPDMFGGAINAKNDNGEITVEGLDLSPGAATSTWVYKPLNATITDAYQLAVESIMGNVSGFTFKSRPAGTQRFVSCDGGAMFSSGTNPKWAIRYGFQFSRHRSNFTAGGIEIPFKGGHHLMWGYYEDDIHEGEVDDENNGPIKRPKFIFIEQVFEESNFSVLGI